MRFLRRVLIFALPVGMITASLSRIYDFNPGDIDIIPTRIGDRIYHQVFGHGCFEDALDYGLPLLPVKDVIFILPPDQIAAGLRITHLDSIVLSGDVHPLPKQLPELGERRNPWIPASAGYCASSSPGVPAEITGHGVSADAHLITVRLYPVQYDPRQGILKLYTTIGISVETSTSSRRTMTISRDSIGRADRISFISQLVENPEDVESELEQSWPNSHTLSAVPSQERMAIITITEFLPAFQRLALDKTHQGCSTGVYTTDEIGSDPAQVLGFIRDKTGQGCEYILLGGGEGVVPIRNSCYKEAFGGSRFTDLYYADCSNETGVGIYSAWNENGNDIYGEPYQNYLTLKGISFTDRYNGWIAGMGKSKGGPIVARTQNGGKTWDQCAFLDYGLPYDVHFLSGETGFIVGSFGIIRSQDGGVSWDAVWDDTGTLIVQDIDFNSGEGWAVGIKDDYPLILHSEDNGLTWTEVVWPERLTYEGVYLMQVSAVSTERVWMVGSDVIFFLDLGSDINVVEEWRDSHSETIIFYGCDFFDAERGCAYGYDGGKFRLFTRLADGQWIETTPNPDNIFFNLSDISCVRGNGGRALAAGDRLYFTYDYGLTWESSEDLSIPDNPCMEMLGGQEDYVWLMGRYPAEDANLIVYTATAWQPSPEWDSETITIEVGDRGVKEWMPDVAVGRLPALSLAQAHIMVGKIIAYENSPPLDGFAETALFMAADMEWDTEDFSCLRSAGKAADEWLSQGRQAWRLFNPVSGQGFTGDEALSAATAETHLERGYNFVYHLDHGTAAQFGTGYKIPGLAPGNKLLAPQIAALDNGANRDRQSVIYSGACGVAQYIRQIDPIRPELGGNVAVEFLRNPYGGATAFIGGVDEVGRSAGNRMGNNLAELLFTSGSVRLGWGFAGALIETSDQSLAYNMHLLGDPSLLHHNHAIDQLSVTCRLDAGSRNLEAEVLDSQGNPVPGATVCAYQKGCLYRVARTGQRGIARFGGLDVLRRDLLLTVRKQNFCTYQKNLHTGSTVSNPLSFDWVESVESYDIEVDLSGNVHLVFSELIDDEVVARYASSRDTGQTWEVSSIDHLGTHSTFHPALTLKAGLVPYVAYLVETSPGHYIIRLAEAGTAGGMDIDTGPDVLDFSGPLGFVASDSGLFHIAVSGQSTLYHYQVYVDDFTSSALKIDSTTVDEEIISPLRMTLVNGTPVIVFSCSSESPTCYYWLPGSGQSGPPVPFSQGGDPVIASHGAFVTLGYIRDAKPRLRDGLLDGTVTLGDEQTPVNMNSGSVELLGTQAFVYSNLGIWFVSRSSEGWSTPVRFASSPVYAEVPRGAINYLSAIGVCSWIRTQDSQIEIYASPLMCFPADGAFPAIVIESPSKGQTWPMNADRTISWFQTSQAEEVSLELSYDGGDGWHNVASLAHRPQGLNYYHWETGRLADISLIPEPAPSHPDCLIRITCDGVSRSSHLFTIGEQPPRIGFASGFDPAGDTLQAGWVVNTGWVLSSKHGCSDVGLELSLDGGDSYSSLDIVSLLSDSAQPFLPSGQHVGSFTWEVPADSTSSAVLRLLAHDTLGQEASCVSGSFYLTPPPRYDYALMPVLPNPVFDEVVVSYSLPYRQHVRITVYDVSGRLVNKLIDTSSQAGIHEITWDGCDAAGLDCPSGVYYVHLETDAFNSQQKFVLLK